MRITANTATALKRDPQKQASELPDDDKVAIAKGREFEVELLEQENEDDAIAHGHSLIEIGYGAVKWWIFNKHWDFESQVIIEVPPSRLPEWNEVNWNDFGAHVSKFFTVGEVTNMSRERIPRDDGQWSEREIKQNVIIAARHLDEIREWWGDPILALTFHGLSQLFTPMGPPHHSRISSKCRAAIITFCLISLSLH